MNIPFSPPDITEEEIEAVAEVMRSGWITTGPRLRNLKERWQNLRIQTEAYALIRQHHVWRWHYACLR